MDVIHAEVLDIAEELASEAGETFAALDYERRAWWERLARFVQRRLDDARVAAVGEISL